MSNRPKPVNQKTLVLGINWPQLVSRLYSCAETKNLYIDKKKREDTETPIFYVENLKWEKPRESTNPEKQITIVERKYKYETRS